MAKTKSFPAPPAHTRFGGDFKPTFTVDKPTGSEQSLLAPDEFEFNDYQFGKNPNATTAEKLVGFLVRGALDQARYFRTLHHEQDHGITDKSRAHIEGLIRSVATASSVRFNELRDASEDPNRFTKDVEAGLAGVDWAETPWAPVPTVVFVEVGDGEKEHSIEFIDQGIVGSSVAV